MEYCFGSYLAGVVTGVCLMLIGWFMYRYLNGEIIIKMQKKDKS